MSETGRDGVGRSADLVGQRRRRTLVGVVVLVALTGLVVAGVWLPGVAPDGAEIPQGVDRIDTVVSYAVVATGASVVVALLYAAWNGGPLLALGIAVGPQLAAAVVGGAPTLNPDLGLALAGGAAAAALAVPAAGRVRTGTVRPTPYPGVLDGLTVATPTVVVALGALLDLRGAVGPHAASGLRLGWLLWLAGTALVALEWAVCLRAVERTGTSRSVDESGRPE